MSEKNQFTYIIIVIFTLSLIGVYAVLNNQIQDQNQTIDQQKIILQETENQLFTLNQRINELLARVQELENALNSTETIDVSDLPGFTVLYSEDFEVQENGSLPIHWTKINGTSLDLVYVTDESGYLSEKSLQLTENGEDDVNCKVRLNIPENDGYLALDMYLQVMGYPACRAVIHFVNEENETFASMNCLLDYRWGNRGPETWEYLQTLPVPVWGQWHHLQIILEQDTQKIRYIVDGIDTGWLDTKSGWEYVTALDLRGNLNYPAVSRYDNITLAKYDPS